MFSIGFFPRVNKKSALWGVGLMTLKNEPGVNFGQLGENTVSPFPTMFSKGFFPIVNKNLHCAVKG